MVRLKIMDPSGHRVYDELTPEEAERLIVEKGNKYWVIDEKTSVVIRELKLKDDQAIALIPKVAGG